MSMIIRFPQFLNIRTKVFSKIIFNSSCTNLPTSFVSFRQFNDPKIGFQGST